MNDFLDLNRYLITWIFYVTLAAVNTLHFAINFSAACLNGNYWNLNMNDYKEFAMRYSSNLLLRRHFHTDNCVLWLSICLVSQWSVMSDDQRLRWLLRGWNSSWGKKMIFQLSLNWGSIVIGCHCFPNVFVLLAVHVWFVGTFRKYSTPTKH